MPELETSSVVVGGGPAGLATAVALRRAGEPAIVVEQGDSVGTAWRARYDRLRLNSSRLTSTLPGLRFHRATGLFPSRDGFVDYLARYVARHGLDVRAGTRVARIERDGGHCCLETSAGRIRARHVVVATGYANEPVVPPWPRRDAFSGPVFHSASYRNAMPFRGRDVLVAGAGSSAMEIAYDLMQGRARRVRLAVRTPPNILLRSMGGVPGDVIALAMLRLPPRLADAQTRAVSRVALGDLSAYGLPPAPEGPFARLRRLGLAPAIVDRPVIDAIRDGRIEIVAGVEGFLAGAVRLSGGRAVEPDAVIAATGYRCGLEDLVGHLGVLDERGVPRIADGQEAAPGLRFVGYTPVPGQIRRFAIEARTAAEGIRSAHARRPQAPAPRRGRGA
jgi:cation diffusion facilitator CzcD-associated flavoprotein CzcO